MNPASEFGRWIFWYGDILAFVDTLYMSKIYVLAFCKIDQKFENLNQKAAAGKTICIILNKNGNS